MDFSVNELPKYFVDGKNCIVTSFQIKNGIPGDYKGRIICEDFFNQLVTEKRKGVLLSQKLNYFSINHPPIGKYSYMYENTEIACNNCKQKIMTNALTEDYDSLDNYAERILPKCNTSYCCKLEYEKIEDAIKRKANE